MLLNPGVSNATKYKVLPTKKYGDRDAYQSIVTGTPIPNVESNIPRAFSYLDAFIGKAINGKIVDPSRLFLTLMNCFQVVFINLHRDENPYRIFESLNAKGKPLTQADLVRNYIAMKLPADEQEVVFDHQWSPIEAMLQENKTVGRLGEMTGFLRHYLAMRTGNLCNEEHVYARFRDRIEDDFNNPDTFIEELSSLRQFAKYYRNLLRPENEANPSIRLLLERLRTFEMSTAFPFLLRAYDAYETDEISADEFIGVLKGLENYTVRHFLCGKQANYLNTMFPTLWKEIDNKRFGESFREVIATKQYPTDQDVRQAIRTAKKYAGSNLGRLGLIFDTVNRKLSEGTGAIIIPDAAPTIEHIMPQSPPTEAWKMELGEEWQETHDRFRHTIGNLTVVTQKWNSSLSNDPFSIKKPKLAENGLPINNIYFSKEIERWSEEAIVERADWLTDMVLTIWPALGKSAPLPLAQPKRLTILGVHYDVLDWKDVLIRTSQVVSDLSGDEFASVAERFPRLFSLEEPSWNRGPAVLRNGWWLCTFWKDANRKRFSQEVAAAAGISMSEWSIEET